MDNIIVFNAYYENLNDDRYYQTHYLNLELSDDYIDNVMKWEEFFSKAGHRKLKVTLEIVEE